MWKKCEINSFSCSVACNCYLLFSSLTCKKEDIFWNLKLEEGKDYWLLQTIFVKDNPSNFTWSLSTRGNNNNCTAAALSKSLLHFLDSVTGSSGVFLVCCSSTCSASLTVYFSQDISCAQKTQALFHQQRKGSNNA